MQIMNTTEGMQLHQQTLATTSFGFPDSDLFRKSLGPDPGSGPGNGRSYVAEAAQRLLNPKSCISKSPVRRRFRASKRTPTTLLNTDAKNFRSLVQKFTGCRPRSTSISFGNTEPSPVNINFACADVDHGQLYVDYNSDRLQQPQLLNYEEEEAECKYSSNNNSVITDDDYLLTSSFPGSGAEIIPQGFLMEDMYFHA